MSELERFKLPCGEEVKTGLLLPEPGVTLTLSEFPDDQLLDPPDFKKAFADDRYKAERKRFSRWVINQSTLGKCNASAATGGVYQVRDNQGFEHVALADNQLYWRINGGRDVGSSLAAGFNEIQAGGISSRWIMVGGQKYRIPDLAYNQGSLPKGVAEAAAQDARRFIAIEAYKVPKTYDRFKLVVASALARRLPIVWAWHVASAGMRLQNGYMQVSRGTGNHANLLQSAKYVGGNDIVHPDNRNSWGPSKSPDYGPMGSGWGDDGFGLVTMEDCFHCIQYHDFYVLTSVKMDPKFPILK